MSDYQADESSDAWKIYVGSLAKWKLAFELWQKAGIEAMMNYNKAVASGKIDTELSQQMSDAMKTSWMESGMEQISQFQKEWQNMVKASGLESLKYYDDKWAKFWSSMEPATSYSEALKQFTETWQNMWKK
jgi:oligoendopeptidase F